MTCGRARSGKYATGNSGMEMAPPKMMKREQTEANTGRSMKKSTNKAGFRPRWSWSVVANFQHAVASDVAGGFVDGDKREELTIDALDGEHRNHRPFADPPGNLCAHLLCDPHFHPWILDRRLGQHGLRVGVHLRRDESDFRIAHGTSRTVEQTHGQSGFEIASFFGRNVNVSFKRTGFVHRSQQRSHRHAIPYMNGNVADNAIHRSADAVVAQFYSLLVYLLVERLELRDGCIVGRLRVVQLLLADDSGIVQFL